MSSKHKRRFLPQGPSRGSKSGLWPSTYQALDEQQKAQVIAAFRYYYTAHPDEGYLEVSQFYQQKFRPGGWWA